MHNNLRNIGLASLICGLIGACAPETAVVKLYEDPTTSKTYERLLIVDVAGNHSDQQRFENAIVNRLKEEQVDAIASHAMLNTSEGVTQDRINEVGSEVDADGILVVHIVSLDTRMETVPGREELRMTCRGGDPIDIFLYDQDVVKEPDSVRVAHTVAVISNLYDGESYKRVWSIQSTCLEKSSMSEALREEAIAIARQLRIDELIG